MRPFPLWKIGNRCRNWLAARRFAAALTVAATVATAVCAVELVRSYYVKERFAWRRHYSQEAEHGSLFVHIFLIRGNIGVLVMRQKQIDPRNLKRSREWYQRFPSFKRFEYDREATSPWRPSESEAPVRGNWFEWHGFDYHSVWESLPSDRYPSTRTFVGVPLWFPAVMFAACASVFGTRWWRISRRRRLGLCPR